ncbi:MAG: hypothetical protein R3D67_04475 [Hyphomicrobiaceae bacterium]
MSGDPQADCTTRQNTSSSSEVAKPHIMVAMAKPATPQIMARRRPKRLEIHPASGMVTAVAIKFDVTTHDT